MCMGEGHYRNGSEHIHRQRTESMYLFSEQALTQLGRGLPYTVYTMYKGGAGLRAWVRMHGITLNPPTFMES